MHCIKIFWAYEVSDKNRPCINSEPLYLCPSPQLQHKNRVEGADFDSEFFLIVSGSTIGVFLMRWSVICAADMGA